MDKYTIKQKNQKKYLQMRNRLLIIDFFFSKNNLVKNFIVKIIKIYLVV